MMMHDPLSAPRLISPTQRWRCTKVRIIWPPESPWVESISWTHEAYFWDWL